jgi:hypothetical protein
MVYRSGYPIERRLRTGSTCRTEGITMPRVTPRPLDEGARARLRDAQKAESDAVATVHAASANHEVAQAKLDAVIAKHRVAINERTAH